MKSLRLDKWRAVYAERCTCGSGGSEPETYRRNTTRRRTCLPHYDAAEGLLTSVILIIAEFCSPLSDKKVDTVTSETVTAEDNPEESDADEDDINESDTDKLNTDQPPKDETTVEDKPQKSAVPKEQRHIISIFKMIQDLLAPSPVKGQSLFKLLMEKLPPEHKARWFSGAALNSAEAAMQSVLSTALSRLNAFLDSELEQVLCFDTKIDAEKFCKQKSAVFLVLPEEDNSKYFLISLIIQQLYREMLSVANEFGGKLPNRVIMFLDEYGTLPKIESAEMMVRP